MKTAYSRRQNCHDLRHVATRQPSHSIYTNPFVRIIKVDALHNCNYAIIVAKRNVSKIQTEWKENLEPIENAVRKIGDERGWLGVRKTVVLCVKHV